MLDLSSLETILSSPVHKKKNKVTYSKFTTVSPYIYILLGGTPSCPHSALSPPPSQATTSTGALL